MNWRPAVSFTPRMRGSMAYVSGAHNVKVGFDQMDNYSDRIYLTNNQGLFYRFNNGVPNQLTMILNNFRQQEHVRGGAAYAQDQWTLRPAHGAGRPALRLRQRRLAGADRRTGSLDSDADRVSGAGRGARLSRPEPARRHGLRPVRQRQDVAEVQRRPLRGHRPVVGHLRRHQPDARQPGAWNGGLAGAAGQPVVDRRESQLRSRLRPAEPGGAGSPHERRRFLRRAEQRQLRQGAEPDEHLRPGAAGRLGHSSAQYSDRRVDPAAGADARERRSGLCAALVPDAHRDRQSGGRRPPTTVRTASRRRSTRGCPAAAAT